MGSTFRPGLSVHERRYENAIDRARELPGEHAAATPLLRLYAAVLAFQADVARATKAQFKAGLPLRQQIDPAFASSFMPTLLQVSFANGPEELAGKARALLGEGEQSWRKIIESEIAPTGQRVTGADYFFARACLQPIAENLQSQLPSDSNYSQNLCPACGGWAQLAVLRPEGEGASRYLLCSFCLREWLFRRIVCPWCGEEDKEKLPRYSAEECAHVHVQACDSCKRYLKAVDMTIHGRAVPLVDEAAWAVLDVWAVDRGYMKIIPNLVGF